MSGNDDTASGGHPEQPADAGGAEHSELARRQDFVASLVGTRLTPEQLKTFNELAVRGLGRLLGFVYEDVGPDRVAVSLVCTPDHVQPAGIVHGGTLAALVEESASIAAWWSRKGAGRAVGAVNTTDFFRPTLPGDTLTAVAEPVHRGKSQQVWTVTITNSEGKLMARGQLRAANV